MDAKPTHQKLKNVSGKYVRTDQNPTHVRLEDSVGYEKFVTVTTIKRHARYIFDETSNRYRVAINGENPTHYRLHTKFYRCGACDQLSQAYRPDTYDKSIKDTDFAYASEHQSCAHLKVKKGDGDIYQGRITGLVKCGSGFICPTCDAIHSDKKEKEINIALYEHYKNGGYVVMATHTVRHKKDYSLSHTLDGFSSVISKMRSGRFWKDFKEQFSLSGYIDSLEYKYTDANGHHPHRHTIFLFDQKPDLSKLKRCLVDKYRTLFKKEKGFNMPSYKHAIDLRLSLSSDQFHTFFDEYLEENSKEHSYSDQLPDKLVTELEGLSSYVCKGLDVSKPLADSLTNTGWTISTEVTHSSHKTAIEKNTNGGYKYTSTGLLLKYYAATKILNISGLSQELRSYFLKQMARFRDLYLEYSNCFKGRRSVYFSVGLKDRYNVKETLKELKDKDKLEELLRNIENPLVNLFNVSKQHLAIIAKHRLKNRVETMAAEVYMFSGSIDRTKAAIIDYISSFKEVERREVNIGDVCV
jgi:hypothetical protein